MVVDPTKVSLAGSVFGAIVSFIVWKVLETVGVAFPYGLGALIPLAGILVGIRDIEDASSSAIIAGLVTVFLAWATNDQLTEGLYSIVVLLGILSLF